MRILAAKQLNQTLSDSHKRSEYDLMMHRSGASGRGMGGAKGGQYQGMSFNSSPFSRADADKVFSQQFGDRNPLEVMQELEEMINSFTQFRMCEHAQCQSQ